MKLTDFTTYGEVRAALGVSEDELEDATLSLDVYWFGLLDEFDAMEVSPVETFEGLIGTGLDQMEPVEQRLYRAVHQFSTYCVAKQLLPSLPMFGPKEISDGKASTVRFSTDPYKETKKGVEAQYEQALVRLEAAIKAFNSVSATERPVRSFFVGVASGSDPVTGS